MNLRPFKRVLIANRGEIAVRIIRGCHEFGVEAVAVYSDADGDALHVRMADAAFHLGPAPSSESYLRADKILEVAKRSGCDAVHPGYGFLSENAGFAQAVLDAGLVWIGPPPQAITSMGTKTEARQVMVKADVAVVPGTVEPVADAAEAAETAREIGFPVMLKAAAGGGGKGLRRVDDEAGLNDALTRAQSEAQKSFGDSRVYIEKLVVDPRHVEIQILADGFGNAVHLFERDCSIQRRHQKVFEETPCPILSEATRTAMGDVAVRAAVAVDYVGAGTCEFLLAADGSFYFLEMNTRLQVEHPITEMVTGVDLVKAQLRVASGEHLWFKQDELHHRGHAVECRIYAEDAENGFRPAPGPLHGYREPGGPWVRVDSGVTEGMEVPIHYDPMVAKLITWGEDRNEALRRARTALRHYHIVGIPTSIPFFLALFDDEAFINGDYTTGFITEQWLAENLAPHDDALDVAIIASAIAQYEDDRRRQPVNAAGTQASPWKMASRWQMMKGGSL